ncbi:hypothetical protein [Nocardioides mangrovi]|uniref:DUF5652 domain-containing protein n=1 Tax=Nocardioides mangrovi TaxID=2874580 RepID=A0ABS7UHL5_9ACTN|nr:hypothetical protein [Nocardioides mangrovi]MBZ5740282.1 hypothetical protein [Nocardioides mangrovi]
MARKRWDELSPRVRRAIVVGATVDGLLKTAALVDLARRPAAEVRGSKRVWGVALVVVNSAGMLPVAYFLRGRVTPR